MILKEEKMWRQGDALRKDSGRIHRRNHYLKPEEVIHHVNGDKQNNHIENLYLCKNNSHHRGIHAKMEQFLFGLIREGTVTFDPDTEEFHLEYC